jgi:hypothetical protein
MRAKAFQILGQSPPPFVAPDAPTLLPIVSADAISWQGSTGAASYDIERATKADGPWTSAARDVDDTWVRYRPMFSDASAEPGRNYYYRVRARNSAGISAPSNVVGPVSVSDRCLVDELNDFSRIYGRGGALLLERSNARPYKEDAHRLKGNAGDWIVYRTSEPLHSVKLLTLMEGAQQDFEFYLSQNGDSFSKVIPKISRFPTEVNPYGYKLPIEYDLETVPNGNTFLKIVFGGNAQISRVEVRYGK